MSIISYAKEHPYATGTIVIIGGILFFAIAFNGGGSSPTVVTDTGPSDAEIAADAAVKSAQIAAQAQTAQAGAAVQAAQIGAGVQLNSDNLAAQVAMAGLQSQSATEQARLQAQREADARAASVALATLDTNATISKATLATQEKIALTQTEAQKAIELNRDNKQAEMVAAGYALTGNLAAENTKMTQAIVNSQVAQSVLDSQTTQSYIQANKEIALAGEATNQIGIISNAETNHLYINSSKEVALSKDATDRLSIEKAAANAQLYITTQGAATTSAINAQKEIDLAAYQAATDKTNALLATLPMVKRKDRDELIQSINTGQVVQSSGGSSTLGNIASIAGSVASVAGLFSDSRLKDNIRHIGVDGTGRNIYEFNYKGSKAKHVGYMADEIKRNDRGNQTGNVRVDPRTGYLRLASHVFAQGSHFNRRPEI